MDLKNHVEMLEKLSCNTNACFYMYKEYHKEFMNEYKKLHKKNDIMIRKFTNRLDRENYAGTHIYTIVDKLDKLINEMYKAIDKDLKYPDYIQKQIDSLFIFMLNIRELFYGYIGDCINNK